MPALKPSTQMSTAVCVTRNASWSDKVPLAPLRRRTAHVISDVEVLDEDLIKCAPAHSTVG
jgi:hypothetical protein